MHQFILSFALLAVASSVYAAPALHSRQSNDTSVTVRLANPDVALVSDTTFSVINDNRISTGDLDSNGPFSTLEIIAGAGANPAIRCQVLNEAGTPISMTRGENFDVTFSDGNNGIWVLATPTVVSEVICDPHFVGNGFDITVTLEDANTGLREDVLLQNFVQAISLDDLPRRLLVGVCLR